MYNMSGYVTSGPEVMTEILYSTHLSMKCFLFKNVKMSTIVVGILTFMDRKNSILGVSEPEKN